MKKLCFLLATIFFMNALLAQRQKARYKIDYSSYFKVDPCCGGIGTKKLCGNLNHIDLYIQHQDNSKDVIWDYDNNFLAGLSFYDETRTGAFYFDYDNPINKIYVDWFFHKGAGSTCNGDVCNGTLNIPVPFNFCNYSYNNGTVINCTNDVNGFTSLSITTKPTGYYGYLTQPLDNAFPSEDTLSILAPVGYAPALYNWQYATNIAGPWQQFPAAYQNRDSINLTATDLLGAGVGGYIEKNIFIRLNALA